MTENVVKIIAPEIGRIRGALCTARDTAPAMNVKHLVRGWLTSDGFSVLFGPSNAGKTFVALGLASSVATGLDWWNCRTSKGAVLYLALEGGKAFQNRIAALKTRVPALGETDLFQYLPLALDLYDPAGYLNLCQAIPDREWSLIVVDTMARAMAGADENAAKDMGQMVDNLTALRDATGAHVMVVHHSGKDAAAGARGSSALRAAADTEINVTANGEIIATKQRDMAASETLHFALETVSFGRNNFGDEVTSAVAVPASASPKRRKPLSGKNEVAMQALQDALRDHGSERRGSEYPQGRVVVDVAHWRDACSVHGLTSGASESAARTAFMRAKIKLIDLNEVREWGDHVWRVCDDV